MRSTARRIAAVTLSFVALATALTVPAVAAPPPGGTNDFRGVNWADPQLKIDWPVTLADAILSEKDCRLPMLANLTPAFE